MAGNFTIEKLKGFENYHTWRVAMRSVLIIEGLEECIQAPVTKMDEHQVERARLLIMLNCETACFAFVQNCETAFHVWSELQNLYRNVGLLYKVDLFRSLTSTRLDRCHGIKDYIDKITSLASKLNGYGMPISDEFLGYILLAGLTDAYDPFIMVLDANQIKISAITLIPRLLHAHVEPNRFKVIRKPVRKGRSLCYTCGSNRHLQIACPANSKS